MPAARRPLREPARFTAFRALALSAGIALSVLRATADDTAPGANARFLGPGACSSSGCHGGADERNNQHTAWSRLDFHHERPYATLTLARSKIIAAAANLGDPVANRACTVCHAPLQTVPKDRLAADANPRHGVSCESCHGPAETWLRSHTRPDYTHRDRVAAGMRDLKDLVARANACVACHQNIDPGLLRAGHPELIFELDGQSAAQPRHWREPDGRTGSQSWLVGQAVALREMTWHLSREGETDPAALDRWAGLVWLLRTAASAQADSFPAPPRDAPEPAPGNVEQYRQWSDALARRAADLPWTTDLTRACLAALAGSSDAFADASVSRSRHARRAERLVLALDRLAAALGPGHLPERLDADLNRLFALAQSLPDFDPAEFSRALGELAGKIPAPMPH